MTPLLHFVIRTPHGAVVDEQVRSARVPTETGQVGLRPNEEPLILVAESGLVVLHTANGTHFAATAGGLLNHSREVCVLYTPFVVAGADDQALLQALNQALGTPGAELTARRQLGELEQRIVSELRHPRGAMPRQVERA